MDRENPRVDQVELDATDRGDDEVDTEQDDERREDPVIEVLELRQLKDLSRLRDRGAERAIAEDQDDQENLRPIPKGVKST